MPEENVLIQPLPVERDVDGSISRFGMYAPPTAGQRANVIADRIESHNSSPIWQRETQAEWPSNTHLLPPRATWSIQ